MEHLYPSVFLPSLEVLVWVQLQPGHVEWSGLEEVQRDGLTVMGLEEVRLTEGEVKMGPE